MTGYSSRQPGLAGLTGCIRIRCIVCAFWFEGQFLDVMLYNIGSSLDVTHSSFVPLNLAIG